MYWPPKGKGDRDMVKGLEVSNKWGGIWLHFDIKSVTQVVKTLVNFNVTKWSHNLGKLLHAISMRHKMQMDALMIWYCFHFLSSLMVSTPNESMLIAYIGPFVREKETCKNS